MSFFRHQLLCYEVRKTTCYRHPKYQVLRTYQELPEEFFCSKCLKLNSKMAL